MELPDVTTITEAQRDAIVRALRQVGWGRKDLGAFLLQIGRTTLYRKIHEYEITEEECSPKLELAA